MKDFLIFAVIFIVVVMAIVFGIISFTNHIGIEARIAKIEQLRSDAAYVDPTQAEDVIGQVTETNQIIISNQVWNDSFWGFLMPDEWDSVKVIEVPR